MPILKVARYEKFAQAIASGIPQADAYRTAGFKSSALAAASANASRLMTRPEIQDRVRELQLDEARRADINRDDIVRMLLLDRRTAHENKQIAAAVRAAELLGKVLGIFIDRREIRTSPLERIDFETLNELHRVLMTEQEHRRSRQ